MTDEQLEHLTRWWRNAESGRDWMQVCEWCFGAARFVSDWRVAADLAELSLIASRRADMAFDLEYAA